MLPKGIGQRDFRPKGTWLQDIWRRILSTRVREKLYIVTVVGLGRMRPPGPLRTYVRTFLLSHAEQMGRRIYIYIYIYKKKKRGEGGDRETMMSRRELQIKSLEGLCENAHLHHTKDSSKLRAME